MIARLSRLIALVVLAAGLAGAWTFATAQEDESEERSRFVRFVEERISTPDRQISLGRIEGALSSDVRISSITISDPEGVWLTINDVRLVWSRLALLRGRLDIDLLEAESIVVERAPVAAEDAPTPAAGEPFTLPDLPVELLIDRLAVPNVVLGEPILGERAELSVEGSLTLAEGVLDADLAIERTDAQPGRLALQANYGEDGTLDLDLTLDEPPGGVLARLIGIPGEPAVRFTVDGTGPLSDFRADITLAVAGEELVSGAATVAAANGGYRFATDLSGRLAPLFPEAYAPYFGGTSALAIEAVLEEDGSITVPRAVVESGVARLEIGAALAPDGFPTAIEVDGSLSAGDGERVPLPGAAGTASIEAATFQVSFGGGTGTWTGSFDLSGLETETLSAEEARITAEGVAENLDDPAARRITFDLGGALTGVAAEDPDLARALGERFDILAHGAWTAGQPVEVEIAEVKNPNAALHFAGAVDGLTLDGRVWLNAADVAPFAGLAGRDISGALTFDATGTANAGTGAFDLTFDALAENLSVGIPRLDPLLAGEARLAGRAARTTEGLRFDDLRITTPVLEARVDGGYDLSTADLTLTAALEDIGLVVDGASGPVSLRAAIEGSGVRPAIEAEITSPALTLDGRRLTEARSAFEGVVGLETGAVDGRLTLSGFLDGVAIDGGARIESLDDGARRISDLLFTAGGTRVEGGVAISPEGLLDGRLQVASPDLSAVAPLALVEASGALEADVRLASANGTQAADVTATARDLAIEGVSVGAAEIDATVADLFGVPRIDGRVAATAIDLAGTRIESLEATATREGETTRFAVDADLEAGSLSAAGALTALPDGYAVALERFRLARGEDLAATLSEPVTVTVEGGTVSLPRTLIDVGGGRIVAEGSVGEALDLSLLVESLPLSLVNAVEPDLEAGGTLSGTIEVGGTPAAPTAEFEVELAGVEAAPLRRLGVPTLSVEAAGRYTGDAVVLDASASGGGLAAAVEGRIPLDGGEIDLDVRLDSLPLALANAVRPDLDLAGSLSGTASIGGTLASPTATFDLAGREIAAAPLRDAGVPPLAVEASGRASAEAVTLDATASGGGISLSAEGTVPLGGGPLDLAVSGDVPLGLADRFLLERGATLSGTANVSLQVGGTLANPSVTGDVAVDDATFTDPETATRLTGISARVSLDGERAVIERVTGVLGGRGSITVTGSIGIEPGSGFPADLAITIDNARFTDGRIVTADLDGRLQVTGPLVGGPLITGEILVDRAEITVPETLPGGGVTFLDVRHRLPPPNVERTLERVRAVLDGANGNGETAAEGPRVDITVNAPRQIFVRGRGIDAELGGSVRVTGPVTDVQPVGAFELIRGSITIIGQRIVFDRGTLTLVGDLDPLLDFVATTSGGGITVTAAITGRASNPEIVLSSVPELPQDEVLAQLLFGRGIDELSPLQIASLAVAVADLAGAGGGADILGQLRAATGLDDLQLVTDAEGNAAVQAGSYVTENVYLGVIAGPSGQADVSVNLDITEDLKARVQVGPDESRFGVFYETEY